MNKDILLSSSQQLDVTSNLYSSESWHEENLTPPAPITKGNLVFPPYNFNYRLTITHDGTPSLQDSLPDDTTLFCLPYDFNGNLIKFEPEVFSSAWAYLYFSRSATLDSFTEFREATLRKPPAPEANQWKPPERSC
ncbi:hypothetical protein [Paracoccus haeundaensis]|uniref:Uncharacterized protein n=1 Tax=Paracoccus haeundaensis TaxID=225362 RepID=A0A5C4RAL3_9RHOB|nr:hypothetical protein [Paracoccus haeundaensis]TNH40959.1 hypothetical protein FHD67_02785 [Paracoccus haeundaensis]